MAQLKVELSKVGSTAKVQINLDELLKAAQNGAIRQNGIETLIIYRGELLKTDGAVAIVDGSGGSGGGNQNNTQSSGGSGGGNQNNTQSSGGTETSNPNA